MPRVFKFAFLCAIVQSLIMSCAVSKTAVNRQPNIILLMADDQGWGDTGYNEHPFLRTPNLDAMAANGAKFHRFYAASAVCSPTRGSVMTGRHPLRYGICHANCGHIKKEEVTLAEMAKNVGYRTGHFGKWHLGTVTRDTIDANRGGRPRFNEDYAPPWAHGFDVCFSTESKVPTWDPMITPPGSAGDVGKSLEEGQPFGTYYWTGPGQIETVNLDGDDSRIIMDRVITFIEEAATNNESFLSVIWFHTPHLPVLTGAGEREAYADLSVDQQHYYGSITAMDKQVGRLRDKLRELGIADNTVLFYTSDNGPEGKSITGRTQGTTNGLRGRKRSLYEGGIRVPGIMEWPGAIKAGIEVSTPCYTSDYFPTIASIIGVDLQRFERPFDGINILPIVGGEVTKRKNMLAFAFQEQAALIGHEFKIYSADAGNTFALYNLIDDPGEANDLASREPEKLKEMASFWKSWKSSLEASSKGSDY